MGKGSAETLKDLNIETFIQGLQEAVNGKAPSLTDEDMAKVLNQYKKRLEAKQLVEFQELAQKNDQAGKSLLAENAKNPILQLRSQVYSIRFYNKVRVNHLKRRLRSKSIMKAVF